MIFAKPKLVLKGSDVMEIEVFGDFSDPGCKASFLFFNLSNKIVCQDNPSTSKVGEYEQEYRLSHFGREYAIYRTFRIVDKTPPAIQLHCEL